jgi:hypothetical protein
MNRRADPCYVRRTDTGELVWDTLRPSERAPDDVEMYFDTARAAREFVAVGEARRFLREQCPWQFTTVAE